LSEYLIARSKVLMEHNRHNAQLCSLFTQLLSTKQPRRELGREEGRREERRRGEGGKRRGGGGRRGGGERRGGGGRTWKLQLSLISSPLLPILLSPTHLPFPFSSPPIFSPLLSSPLLSSPLLCPPLPSPPPPLLILSSLPLLLSSFPPFILISMTGWVVLYSTPAVGLGMAEKLSLSPSICSTMPVLQSLSLA